MADAPLSETEINEGGEPEEKDGAWLDKVLAKFDSVAEPQAEMRSWSLEDRRFVVIPGAQWEGPIGLQWENAPRPEVDKISKGVEKIELDYRDNRMIADYLPVGDDSDEDTAETLDGVFRADAYHYKAAQAWDTAFGEAIRGGMGAWRLTTDYADPYDPDNDAQRINPGISIPDADQSVYFDGASKLQDASDAKWCFVVSAEAREVAKERWGEGIADWPYQRIGGWYDWYTPDVVRIAEYYEVEETSDKLLIFSNSLTDEEQRFFATELGDGVSADLTKRGWTKRTRSVKRRRVHKYILSGSAVLKDCGYIAGPNIPIVPVYGRTNWVDNQRWWEGRVRKQKDPQRGLNAGIARLTETDSRAPYAKPIFAPEQVAHPSIQEGWATGNINRDAYYLAEPLRNPDGGIATAGPVGMIEPPEVPAVTVQLLQFHLGMLTDDDDNTDQVQANVSGEAMEIAKTTINEKSGIYIDNMRQAHQRGAEIYEGIAREVYYEEGRKVDTLSEDGQDGQATLVEAHYDPVTRIMSIRNDLSKGRYKVIADVQEATASRRAKTVKESLNIAAVATQAQDMDLAQASLLTAVQQMDGEGMGDLRTYARKKAISIGLTKPTEDEQQEIAQAQANQPPQQPPPADVALMATAGASQAQAQKFMAEAKKAEADAVDKIADAGLKRAQATVLEKAPRPPQGLATPVDPQVQAANDAADVASKQATARLTDAKAAQVVHDIHNKRIRTGAELQQQAHQQEMDRQNAQQQGQSGAA